MFHEVLAMAGSLILIILILVLTYYATRWYARRMGQRAGTGKYIRVLDSAALGTGASAVIIQVDTHYYLLGVGEKQVNLLCELSEFDPLPPEMAQAQPFSTAFKQVLEKARGGKGGDPRS